MRKTAERFYLLGGASPKRFRFDPPAASVRKRSEIHQAILQAAQQGAVWIATHAESTDDLLREVSASHRARAGFAPRLGRLLLLFPPRLDSLPALEELFHPVAWGTSSFRVLPDEELAEALTADNRHDLFIGGLADTRTQTLILYRGDLGRLAVPLSLFRTLGIGPEPNPSELSFTDYGQTIRLGTYEAAADAVLYEVDPTYRRRINAKRRDEEKSFGASLRRLRVLKGLRQSDFSSIPAKTIARIERGEVGRPHPATLAKIAKYLRVEAGEIGTY